MPSPDEYFVPFQLPVVDSDLPRSMNNPLIDKPHRLAVIAGRELQLKLENMEWEHNFGLEKGHSGKSIGKMFGVLVVKTSDEEIGYLAAFSGKIGDSHEYSGFVPPVWDGLKSGGVLDIGMKKLESINEQITQERENTNTVSVLKQLRTDHSNSLQDQIYDGYQFLNIHGIPKNLRDIFHETHHANPPGGAGDCAAPKLLQYAFAHKMKPLTLAEFWWGNSSDSPQWKHLNYYPACTHKCEPILRHMLEDLVQL